VRWGLSRWFAGCEVYRYGPTEDGVKWQGSRSIQKAQVASRSFGSPRQETLRIGGFRVAARPRHPKLRFGSLHKKKALVGQQYKLTIVLRWARLLWLYVSSEIEKAD
jgi:hypothetical protein